MATIMAPDSPKALYHSIPQAPEPSTSQIDLAASEEEIPQDLPAELVDGRTKSIIFILGCAVLLPWNVIITAMPYFLSRLEGSSFKSSFSSYATTIFTFSNLAFLAHATLTSKHAKPSHRTRAMILWILFLNALLTLSTFFRPAPGLFAAFVLFNGAAQAAAGGYLQTSIIAVASLFGPPAVQAMIAGQAAVAVVVSGVQVISSATSIGRSQKTDASGDGSAEERSAFIFFALSTLFLVGSYVAHEWLVRTPIYDRVAGTLERGAHKISLGAEEGRPLNRSLSRARSEVAEEASNVIRVAKANALYEIAVAAVFMITLSVFPPVTISVSPTNPDFHPLLFASIHFLVFNVGDFIGRWMCSFRFMVIWSAKALLSLSFARILFIPLFLMCNIQRPSAVAKIDPPVNSDFVFMLLMLAFGWTNGYVSSLCMMAAPSVEHNPRLKGRMADVDVAATVASFCLVGGLALGSISSFAVRAAICNCNPFTT
ncbi:nucleoside transporter [Coprinopsis cinerea AmutBmut pab1-1]|nr:nucleoside transporter [Coprinopsis cinerea AmutBmut pab1-1]